MSSAEEGQSAGLHWIIQRQHELVTITLRGELDMGSSTALQALLEETVSASQVTVVDLEALDFMDSTGLRVFARAQQSTAASGARFLLGRPSAAVQRILQVSGLIEHFNYVEGAPPGARVCPACDGSVGSADSACAHCGSTI